MAPGVSANNHFEGLSLSGKMSSDYYTQEEMLQLKNPKKQKSLRKKEKLDIDTLEAEAVSAGLGLADLGSRKGGRRQTIREEQQKSEAEKISSEYQLAYAKADEEENLVFASDDDDIYKSLERARNLDIKKINELPTGPQAIALLLATTSASSQIAKGQNPASGEPQKNKVVFTEMEEFIWGLQPNKEDHKTDNEDAIVKEDHTTKPSDQKVKDETGAWREIKNEQIVLMDVTMHEVPVGKGLSGALKLLKERGTLKEPVEWGGRNTDKKPSKLVAVYKNDEKKEIRIERTDEFGRIMTPKEAFRMISHKFYGKGPGKMKQEKRLKQYQEELKLKQMKN